ncbi:MAG: AAA family ATPase [Rhizobacter sp.]|nr:AAA family ATPase [Chlorobiales bacterium]
MSWDHIIGQLRQKDMLRRAIRQGRLPNAYLFTGPEGTGKEATAIEVAKVLNCDAADALISAAACGVCTSCEKFATLSHPNIEILFPVEKILLEQPGETGKDRDKHDEALERLKSLYAEKCRNPYFTMRMDKSMGILTSQVEALLEKSLYKPAGGKRRVFLISQAERLGGDAANKLLKLLEEPPSYVLFILVSSQPEKLLPTIVSRCQPVRFAALAAEQMLEVLTEKFGDTVDASQLSFNARFARGSFSQALKLSETGAGDEPHTPQKLRDEALELLRNALASGRAFELMRRIEDAAKRDRPRESQSGLLAAMLVVFEDVISVQAAGVAARITNADQREVIERFAKNFPDGDFETAARETEQTIYRIAHNASPLLAFIALALNLRRLLRPQ